MRWVFRLHVQSVLNRFPEVTWDRFAGDEDHLVVFGWIDRDDRYKDFMAVTFKDCDFISFMTSSARYSKEFSARVGCLDRHRDCQRVENHFIDVRVVSQSRPEQKH